MPKPTQARLATIAVPLANSAAGNASGWAASTAPSSADCASSAVLDAAEYIDINPLREFGCIRAWLEDGYEFQIVRIGLQLLLEHGAYGMVMVGVISHHPLQIREAGGLRRVGLE